MDKQKPSVGRIVHYLSYGTPKGEYQSVCRAAIITKIIQPEDPNIPVVALCVLNPEGMFFNKWCEYSDEKLNGGTWHWPERV
jgi:hypothetical protein